MGSNVFETAQFEAFSDGARALIYTRR
ncbi:hypothetical protein CCACVL1_19113 [Corchorus capsularis]|uniref:Uncharacterized protein n=1 Tax=Corchorus capsularis TaxID=210143 RepID=A0A1R3HIF9_COCAP|nr:hypothetical protein CCACVL1_19113 [Corchorus capsularis]